jgi:uncharacterized protein HemX
MGADMPTMDATTATLIVAVIAVVGNYLIMRRKSRNDLDLERFRAAQQEAKDLMDRLLVENRELRHKSRNQEQQAIAIQKMLEVSRRSSEERQAQIAELRKQVAVMNVRVSDNRAGIEEVKAKALQVEQVAIEAIAKAAEKPNDPDCP